MELHQRKAIQDMESKLRSAHDEASSYKSKLAAAERESERAKHEAEESLERVKREADHSLTRSESSQQAEWERERREFDSKLQVERLQAQEQAHALEEERQAHLREMEAASTALEREKALLTAERQASQAELGMVRAALLEREQVARDELAEAARERDRARQEASQPVPHLPLHRVEGDMSEHSARTMSARRSARDGETQTWEARQGSETDRRSLKAVEKEVAAMQARVVSTHGALTDLEARFAVGHQDAGRMDELEKSIQSQVRVSAGLDGRLDSLHERLGEGVNHIGASEMASMERRFHGEDEAA